MLGKGVCFVPSPKKAPPSRRVGEGFNQRAGEVSKRVRMIPV